MAAYAAVVSLHHTINALLNLTSPSSSRETLELAYKEASSLLQVLEGLNGSNRSRRSMERVDALEGQIRDSAHKLEDVLEFHELKQQLEEEVEDGDEGAMMQEIHSFCEAAKRLEEEHLAELESSREDDDDDDEDTATGSSDIDFGVEMIGRSHLFDGILEYVPKRMRPDDRFVCAFLGEQGSGSRLAVKTVFENAREAGEFERWGWARGHELKHVLMSLIAQAEPDHVDDDDDDDDDELLNTDATEDRLSEYLYKLLNTDASEDRLSEHLYKALENRRYMIVLDGVDDVELLNFLLMKSFPDQGNGSVVFVTTISPEVVRSADLWYKYELTDILEEELAFHLRQILFGWESFPAELEVAAKEIVLNCGRRPVSFDKTFVFLSKSERTVEHWIKIAADKENPIFAVADEISEISEIKKEIQSCEPGVARIALQLVDYNSRVVSVNLWMYPERYFSKLQIISFFGMVGIGKTLFVRNIFKNDKTLSRFDHRVWIPIGLRYRTKEILIDILAQIYPHIPKLDMKSDETLIKELCAQVSNKRCLIVLDDLCSQAPLHRLREIFPAIKGTILVTTRLRKVAKFGRDDITIEMQLLGEEESWLLLRRKVFDRGLCPPELDKAGRKIAAKCDGLPLLILTVADQLRKVEQSEEYWNNVASGKEKSVFKHAHHQISEALVPNYHNLPQHLKPCFLYIGVFLERYDIPTSNLTNLWISEGFLKSNMAQMEEDFVAECLSELVDISLVMVKRNVSSSPITTCRLHSVFWHLSNTQAAKSKLFHAMNSYYDDCSIENIASQRRLCIRDNILLSMKDVQKSMASNTSVHSFLCVGPLHQYPVPLNFDLKLLRVMNALTIRLYEFPNEVKSLLHLRYLSLTCNGELPASISKLRKLQCLIVKRHMSIKSSRISSHLPLEIWDMMELKHLQIMGGCLPNHSHGYGLLKLSTLLDVSAQSCREEVLKWIPNLKRLGIRIELAPTNESNSFPNMDGIYHLNRLESLKCVVVNPQIGSKNVPPAVLLTMLPPNLKRLSLSGLGYSWEHMSTIGKLKNLEVLKLKCYAFQGPKWEMNSTNQFEKLKFLLLEDMDLVKWKFFGHNSMEVECLCIKHCYKLREFPVTMYTKQSLRKIEIVDGTPLLVANVVEIKQSNPSCEVNIHRSWLANTHQNDFQHHLSGIVSPTMTVGR